MLKNYLINESPLVILPTLAKCIGLNEAIVLQQVHYWLTKKKHFYDEKYWTYSTYKEWLKQFPFFSESTLIRTVRKLEDMGLLTSNNYNKNAYDRTKWYTINYDVLDSFETISQNDKMETSQNDKIKKPKKNSSLYTDTNTNTNLIDENHSQIQRLFLTTFGRNPKLPEVEAMQELLKTYSEKELKRVMKSIIVDLGWKGTIKQIKDVLNKPELVKNTSCDSLPKFVTYLWLTNEGLSHQDKYEIFEKQTGKDHKNWRLKNDK